MEQYFKDKLGKGVDYTKIVIWDDMLIIRGEGFSTTPEKFICAFILAALISSKFSLQRLAYEVPVWMH